MFQNISMCVIKCKHYKIIIVTKLSKISAPFYVNSKNYQHLSKILKDWRRTLTIYFDYDLWIFVKFSKLFFKTKWMTKQAFGQFDPYFCHQRIERRCSIKSGDSKEATNLSQHLYKSRPHAHSVRAHWKIWVEHFI